MKKKFLSLLLALAMCLSLGVPAFAASPEEVDPNVGPIGGADYYYTKRVTRTYEGWSESRRVSSNLSAGPAGGTISCDRVTTFSLQITGEVSGLGFGVGTEVSSSVGYTINVPANRTAYMSFKAWCVFEEGIREKRSTLNNQIISENDYIIGFPQYGQYELVFVD